MAKGWEDRLTGERVWQAREKEESRKEGQEQCHRTRYEE